MQKRRNHPHTMDLLFVLTLLFLFAFSSIALILSGARIYESNVESSSTADNTRIAGLYITEKIRQADTEDSITVSSFADGDALCLSQNIGDTVYHTYLYLYDGSLREILVKDGYEDSVDAAGGNKIMELSDFHMQMLSDHLLSFTITDTDNNSTEYVVHVRSGQ